jgi:PilZ domain
MSPEDPLPGDAPVLAERRAAERYACPLPLSWQVLGSGPDGVWSAGVRDVSTAGIGLMALTQPVRAGEVLVIRLRLHGGLSRPMPVRVMHAKEEAGANWCAGCRFVRPLSQRELQGLLDEASADEEE